MLGGIGRGQQNHFFEHQLQIGVFQVQFARPRKIHQDLHHPVEAMNFIVDNVDMTPSVRIDLLHLVPQQLQMQHDGVDWILDFMSDPTGHTAAGRNTARKFDLIFDSASRFGIAHGK